MSNNELYWNIEMKFYDLEDSDVDKLKKDIDDQNSNLYGMIFAWNNLIDSGKIEGLSSFKTNFTKFFGLDNPSEERKIWYDNIDEVTERWNEYMEGSKAWKIKEK